MDKLLKILFLFTFVSCVGTVQDAKVKLNSLFEENKTALNFAGIDEARAISHNKIEVEFTPSSEINPNLKYQLYINNSLSPVEINPDSLDKAANGRVRYLIDSLTINTKYKLRMRLKNSLTQAMSKNEKEFEVTTFDNKTADFKGITSVSKLGGQSDTTIRVDWISALMEGTTLIGPWDPFFYEVTLISDIGGVSNINNNNYIGGDRRRIRVPPLGTNLSPFNYTQWTSQVIGQLQPNTQYYVQVRAINKLYDDLSSLPGNNALNVSKELNTKFLTIKTDPATGVFDYNQASFRANAGAGALAKTTIATTWIPASGTYVGYRLFYTLAPCESRIIVQPGGPRGGGLEVGGTVLDEVKAPPCTAEEVLSSPRLTPEKLQAIVDGVDVVGKMVGTEILTSVKTSHILTGLEAYSWYQLRLVACRTAACTLGTNEAILSETRAVQTAPSLASFSGLVSVLHPDSSESMNQVSLKFDPPDLSIGHADTLDVFCIDPESITKEQNKLDFVRFADNRISGSSIRQCNDLILCGPNSNECLDGSEENKYLISSSTNIRVKGVESSTGKKYCFAAAPAMRGDEEHIVSAEDSPQDWIIRCITPEIKTPTIAQFPGANSSCGVVNDTLTVSWPKPTGGIYSNYRVFWREIKSNETFSFSAASGLADVDYKFSGAIGPDTLSYTMANLRPGTRYKVGVLTQSSTDGGNLWSEFNTNVRDCVTAMPKYKFEEWTRIFAIGPKTDGRYPYLSNRSVDTSAYIYESLNADGIPYEVSISASNLPNFASNYQLPPGNYGYNYTPGSYGDPFDGAASTTLGLGTGMASSNSGIVSLAWKDVSLDFLDLEFKQCQITEGENNENSYCFKTGGLPATKNLRRYGYKVFRSIDNRLSWEDITKNSGSDSALGSSLIYAKDYSYLKRADSSPTTERMAFFTDYSVASIKSDPTANSRARIYWYRIVPYFDNKIIAIDSTQSGLATPPNEIKVILPPANMALVHRWMSNRQACNELLKDSSIDKLANYTCAFNGFGAKPKGIPWNSSNSVVDLGGHLLIDRFELGCNYTRGDAAGTSTTGLSYFTRSNMGLSGWKTPLTQFQGYPTDSVGNNLTDNRFMGCATKPYSSESSTTLVAHEASTLNSDPRKFIKGDCLSAGTMLLAEQNCASEPNSAEYWTWSFPGAFLNRASDGKLDTKFDCTAGSADRPTNATELLNPNGFLKNLSIQSEFAAVLHHMSPDYGKQPVHYGPNGEIIEITGNERYPKPSSCYINLAAIGSDKNWISRWVSAGDLSLVKGVDLDATGTRNLSNTTIQQTRGNTQLFNASTYKAPDGAFLNRSRFDDLTKIGRVLSSNAAKLPPITNLSIEAAQQLCSTYDVEIGFSNNGSNFLSLTLPKKKRLLSRQELVSASAWSDASTKYSDTQIRSLEANSCVNNLKTTGSTYLTQEHASSMNAEMSRVKWPDGSENVSNGSGVLIGGSSYNDGTKNSQLCVSKYGIQDLIGNASEITTDRLFCEYGKDQLYFGKYADDRGVKDKSVETTNFDETQTVREIIWTDAKVVKELYAGAYDAHDEAGLEDVIPAGSNIRMWADISPGSGYCSIVDATDPGDQYPSLYARFRDLGGNFTNIFNPNGLVNSTVVNKANNIYQPSIDMLRNGDGYFLNFGNSSPGPSFLRSNSLAISQEGYGHEAGMALGPYFNSVIGIPMSCPGSTCSLSEDNKLATTNYFSTHPDAPKPNPASTMPFPTGNSQLMNLGISETNYFNGSPVFELDFSEIEDQMGIEYVIYEIVIKFDGTKIYKSLPKRTWANSFPGGMAAVGRQSFSRMRFVVPRQSSLQLTHGSDASSSMTGRFSLNTLVAEQRFAKRAEQFTGARCGVLIED